MTGSDDAVAAFKVGDWLVPRFHAVQEVPCMASIIAHRIAGLILRRRGPEFRFIGIELRLYLRATDGMATGKHASDKIVRGNFGIAPDLEAGARGCQRAVGAVKEQTTHALSAASSGGFAILANGGEPGILDDGILPIGHFAVVFEKEPAAGAVN